MDITNLVQRFTKKSQPRAETEEFIPASVIENFDVAERISYIGMLRREIDALDFSSPILKTLFADKKEDNTTQLLADQYAYIKNDINQKIISSNTSAVFLRADGAWTAPLSKNKSTREISQILTQNLLKARQDQLIPYCNDIEYVRGLIGHSIDSISIFADVQPMMAPIAAIPVRRRVVNETTDIVETQAFNYAVQSQRTRLGNMSPELPAADRIIKGLYEVENNLINHIRTSTPEVRIELLSANQSDSIRTILNASYAIAKKNNGQMANHLLISEWSAYNLLCTMGVVPNSVILSAKQYNTHVGTLIGNIKVYTSPFIKDNELLLYHKSDNNTGFVYCPYQIYNESGIMVNPITFQPTIGAMTCSAYLDENICNYYTRFRYD